MTWINVNEECPEYIDQRAVIWHPERNEASIGLYRGYSRTRHHQDDRRHTFDIVNEHTGYRYAVYPTFWMRVPPLPTSPQEEREQEIQHNLDYALGTADIVREWKNSRMPVGYLSDKADHNAVRAVVAALEKLTGLKASAKTWPAEDEPY